MRHTMTSLVLAGSLAMSAAASAQPAQSIIPPSSSTLQDAAVQLGHDYDNLYRAKDAAAMANLYSANGELVSPGGKLITGHDALQEYYRQRFASGAFGHKITVLETHPLGDAGYSIANFSVSVPTKGKPNSTHQEQGHITAVYVHDSAGWHFALVQPSVTPATGE
jgi:ketosteroid isomerase-like protein